MAIVVKLMLEFYETEYARSVMDGRAARIGYARNLDVLQRTYITNLPWLRGRPTT